MKVLKLLGNKMASFWCPGCNCLHTINYGEDNNPSWTWNGDQDKPSFSPSVLTRYDKITEKGKVQYEEWVKNNHKPADMVLDKIEIVCHSFVKNGEIQFLNDCTHELAGQTVKLPKFPKMD